ncbi:type IV toxin-antitoxin system AbiEi family antitoxin domain-containing protein [Corynebacterium sp. zg-331]|nr:type IV toxin-antitoxin system AbiEi family antitoxin domain-containing protein [Corynebacterium sp. zg-331]
MGIDGITIFSTAELRRRGETRSSLARRLREGSLHRIMRGLYSEKQLTPRQLCAAYSLLKPQLAFTGATAIQLFLGQAVTLPLRAVVPRGKSDKGTKNLRITRRRCLPTTLIEGIKVLCAAAVVRDLSLLPPTKLVAALASVQRRLHESSHDLLRRVLEHHYAGRNGPASLTSDTSRMGTASRTGLTTILRRSCIGADSETERRAFRPIKMRGWKITHNVKIGNHFWDAYVEGKRKVLIDIDGTAFHGNDASFVKDRWKTNDAVSRGYYALRYTSACVDHHCAKVVEDIIAIARGLHSPFRDDPVWRWHRSVAECRHASTADKL